MNWMITHARKAKLNLWLLLTFFLGAGTFLAAIHDVSNFGIVRYQLNSFCATADSAYWHGGPQRLSLVLDSIGQGLGMQPHLLDLNGRDLANGADRSAWLLTIGKRRFPFPPGGPIVVRKFASTVCVLNPPSGPPQLPVRPSLWVVPFLSLLCCTVSVYITLRLRRIEAAVNHFGSGQLGARATTESGDPIGRLARSFNQMADRIESLLGAHRQLCADISHELRSPLARLLLAVRSARLGAPGALDRIETEVSRVDDLLDELLDVVRAEVEPATMCSETIDLGSILTEIADRYDIEARDRTCDLALWLFEPGSLACDPELLRRAVENVLRNALQHSPPGSAVELWAGGDADHAIIRVRDYGKGVPESALQDIFRAFYRVELDADRSSGGSGLGLAIAQRAIAVHRGTISAENASPGLLVEIRLPRNPTRQERPS
jgi:signal transduction histidine kinase